jgi:hypothetical protein
MLESTSPAPPAWVYKRDGRLVPFEPDKISRSLFAATESLGRPNAFLARELTDGILHFLAGETEGAVPTTTQIAELVAKVVRELGQPTLAQAYADHARQRAKQPVPRAAAERDSADREGLQSPDLVLHFSPGEPLAAVQRACLRSYTLQTVFTRDLAAAQEDGLLTLTGLETPHELAGCVLNPPGVGDRGLVESIEAARLLAGSFLAVDGPEYFLWHRSGTGDVAVADYIRELGISLRATRLRAVVNLNSATPPAWADELADGPLFAAQRRSPEPERLAALADALLEGIGVWSQGSAVSDLSPALDTWPLTPVRLDWHLAERDFRAEAEERLLRLARRAVEGAPLAFVFDRPRRPVALAEGIDRKHPAVLVLVGLHLPRLADQPGLRADPALFLHKLGSLARLALSAATQKRDFLRRHHRDRTALTRGFLLDRARLVVAPVGLDRAVRGLLGRGLCEDVTALEFARQAVKRLGEVLRQDGRHSQLDTCLDALADFFLGENPADPAGLTPWDVTAPVKSQLRAAGVLHAAEAGTAAVLVPEGSTPTAEQTAGWLRWAWQHTDVVRLRFVRFARPHQQLTFGG